MIPCLLPLLLLTQAPEIRSTAADRTELGITLYHGGYAMVRERRKICLPEGEVRLALEDVANTIEPKTVQFRILSGAPVDVKERNFEFDLLSPKNLVKHSLGARVWISNPLEGGQPIEGNLSSLPTLDIYAPPRTPLEAKLDPMPPMERIARIYRGRFAKRRLLEGDPGTVVRLQDGYVPVPPGELSFAVRPSDLRSAPTLLITLSAIGPGQRSAEVVYLAKGLDWHATYTATLNLDAKRMDLDAFVTLTNESGSPFPNASLQLLAGAPNRVPDLDPNPYDPDIARLDSTTVTVVASADPFTSERIGDNQLFTLGRPTSLSEGQTKQIALFSAAGIAVERRSVLGILVQDRVVSRSPAGSTAWDRNNPSGEWSSPDSEQTRIRFVNKTTNHLGRPLPQGQLYVNYRNPQGLEIPLFHEWVDETPEGEEAEISIGPIAGLSGHWRMAEVKRGVWFRRSSQQATVEVRISNNRASTESVEIHAVVGTDWKLLSATHPGTKDRSDLIVFRLPASTGQTLLRATFLVPDPKP